jgi:hypothetical protein
LKAELFVGFCFGPAEFGVVALPIADMVLAHLTHLAHSAGSTKTGPRLADEIPDQGGKGLLIRFG